MDCFCEVLVFGLCWFVAGSSSGGPLFVSGGFVRSICVIYCWLWVYFVSEVGCVDDRSSILEMIFTGVSLGVCRPPCKCLVSYWWTVFLYFRVVCSF